MTGEQSVIFYDGQCKVCNLAVGFVIRRDRRNKFHFSSLQSDTAAEALPGIQINKQYPESIVYLRDGKTYQHSGAVLQICKDLGRGWQILYVFMLVPAPIRDLVYRYIAQNRYRWFGRNSACPVIPPGSRLD
jgi:predicted DCC family thiol-disulfide oxidoreductase YuxK